MKPKKKMKKKGKMMTRIIILRSKKQKYLNKIKAEKKKMKEFKS